MHEFTDIRVPIEKDNPSIMRDESKCIKCGMCKTVCREKQSVAGFYDLIKTGDKAICINCGQCANVCPVESITERYDYEDVRKVLKEGKKTVIIQTSPSVRVGLGEAFGMPFGEFVEGKLVAALKKLGIKYVFDTTFGADLTIMEEANEFIKRIQDKDCNKEKMPMFTSCCPAWVKFVETWYPERIKNLSTSKSPILMQGATIKSYFSKKLDIDMEDIYSVAVTPCTAKKFEITRDEFNSSGRNSGNSDIRDMDKIITTRELAKWLKEENIDIKDLEDKNYDDLKGSGAGVIFGNTGGVMEAAVRSAYYFITNNIAPKELAVFKDVRGLSGVKKAQVFIPGAGLLNLGVVHTTANARKLLDDWDNIKDQFDFIEVMACEGGCIGGGGQPKCIITDRANMLECRIDSIYNRDNNMELRQSHENPTIKEVYDKFFNAPLSEVAEEYLHTYYYSRKEDLGK